MATHGAYYMRIDTDMQERILLFLDIRYLCVESVFFSGSMMRANATDRSDLDLVVICKSVPAAAHETITFEDLLLDIFVHDAGTLLWFMQYAARLGHPPLLDMMANGIVRGRKSGQALMFQSLARNQIGSGPDKLFDMESRRLRYLVTEALDDVADAHGDASTLATISTLYLRLTELILRARGRWNATGKWIPSALNEADSGLGDALSEAFYGLICDGNKEGLLVFVEGQLNVLGGRLTGGYVETFNKGLRLDDDCIK